MIELSRLCEVGYEFNDTIMTLSFHRVRCTITFYRLHVFTVVLVLGTVCLTLANARLYLATYVPRSL